MTTPAEVGLRGAEYVNRQLQKENARLQKVVDAAVAWRDFHPDRVFKGNKITANLRLAIDDYKYESGMYKE